MSETLSVLRGVEQSARRLQEQARQDAAAIRAGVPGEIEVLREEKNRRVQSEKRKLEAAARKEVESTREALSTEVDGKIRALHALRPWLEEKAVALLRSLLVKG